MKNRLWVLLVVVVAALSLTSCGKRKSNLQSGFGFVECNGAAGSFDVYVIPMSERPGQYEVSIFPIAVDQNFSSFSAGISNSGIQNSATALRQDFPVVSDAEIILGTLTEAQLFNDFDTLIIGPYQPGIAFTEADSASDAVCELPLPNSSGTN